jgi:hypothetical protein
MNKDSIIQAKVLDTNVSEIRAASVFRVEAAWIFETLVS